MDNQCTAKSKQSGERCRRAATPGKSVCYYHGGAKGIGGRNNVKHNLYSRTLADDPELLEAYEYFKTNPNLTDMSPEIAMAQAYFHKWLKNRPAGSPVSADYIGVVGEYVEKLTRMKEKEHKRSVGELLTIRIDQLGALIEQITDAVAAEVSDPATRAAIAARIAKIGGKG
jgi:hypothetical protein